MAVFQSLNFSIKAAFIIMELIILSYRLSNQMPNQVRQEEKPEEGKRKFFFVVEGEKTECIYVRGIANHANKNALLDVILLERMKSSESNQYKITSTIKNYIEKTEKLSEQQIIELNDLMLDFEEETVDEISVINKIAEIIGDDINFFLEERTNNVIDQLKALEKLITYEKGHDKICLILDRDYRSFTASQYDEVLTICQQSDFILGISNPNFEFYLFLHINDASKIDKETIIRNPKMTKGKNSIKYTERLLKDELKCFDEKYSKNKFNVDFFISNFDKFLKNIENFSQDNNVLKDEIGSSVHHIIKQVIQ